MTFKRKRKSAVRWIQRIQISHEERPGEPLVEGLEIVVEFMRSIDDSTQGDAAVLTENEEEAS